MGIKTVLSIMDAEDFEFDLKQAVDFCTTCDAHLTVVLMVIDPDVYTGTNPAYSIAYIRQREEKAATLSRNARVIGEFLASTGLSYDVQDVFTEIACVVDDIADRALYSDLVLVGRQAASKEAFRRFILSGALFHSPTPVYFDRSGRAFERTGGTVLVAWDSGNAAAHAVHAAMDLLVSASLVRVVLIDPLAVKGVNGEEPGADVATYLARHGVKVEVDCVASGGRSTDEVLLERARDAEAKLMVMGAYRHSRLKERLFGGVTRSMLETDDVALFLSH
ncbi:universal stress protein [Rhizobium sp. BK376]|uniref:universal stress protein n=1 Tax=Rhizobium sp. BK376 TaxID=2512149 RepID=UPI0010453FAF|nr:universal stress protein [Rhizobium sp. BK376]TCR75610.1 nucleotide-binding universal stress UspA family protein [Rhizobium sp. BK376]